MTHEANAVRATPRPSIPGGAALFGTLAALWAYGATVAIASGWEPTPFRTVDEWPYPTQAVFGVIALVSAEVLLLYAIIRPRSYAASWRRLAAGIVVCFGLLVGEALRVGLDSPGYAYVNAGFLATAIFVLAGLLAIQGASLLISRESLARRHAA